MEIIAQADALLFGRVTYEMMEAIRDLQVGELVGMAGFEPTTP